MPQVAGTGKGGGQRSSSYLHFACLFGFSSFLSLRLSVLSFFVSVCSVLLTKVSCATVAACFLFFLVSFFFGLSFVFLWFFFFRYLFSFNLRFGAIYYVVCDHGISYLSTRWKNQYRL